MDYTQEIQNALQQINANTNPNFAEIQNEVQEIVDQLNAEE
jgi:hypothetical protein